MQQRLRSQRSVRPFPVTPPRFHHVGLQNGRLREGGDSPSGGAAPRTPEQEFVFLFEVSSDRRLYSQHRSGVRFMLPRRSCSVLTRQDAQPEQTGLFHRGVNLICSCSTWTFPVTGMPPLSREQLRASSLAQEVRVLRSRCSGGCSLSGDITGSNPPVFKHF